MRFVRSCLSNGIRVTTLTVCVLTLAVSISRAQFRPPPPIQQPPPIRPPITPPPPIMQPPKFNPPVTQPPKFNPPVTPPIMQPPKFNPPVTPPPPIMQPPPFNPPVVQPPIMQPPPFNPNPPVMPNPNVREWSCTKCGKVHHVGPTEPVHITNCPFCGVRFINVGDNGGMMNPPIHHAPPIMPVVNEPGGAVGNNPAHGNGPARSSERSNTGLIVGLVAGGIFFLIVVAGIVIAIVMACGSGGKKKSAKRRRRYDDDE